MYLSQGSAWMPRVTPRSALKDMLFCTGPRSGSPSAHIFSRCQFSLNQPRASPCTGRSNTSIPGMFVVRAVSSLPNSRAMGGHPFSKEEPRAASRTTRGRGPRRTFAIAYCPWAAYLASVASLAGRHQASLSRYQAMVSARPAAKSVWAGSQPSSRRSLELSMA